MKRRYWTCALLLLLAPLEAAAVSVDLGSSDVAAGLVNSQRGDGTDGENDPSTCGPEGGRREGRVNRGTSDDDYPDFYFYFRVDDPAVKSASRLRISATFFDDPAFAARRAEIRLQYTSAASTGPGDLADTFFPHPAVLTLSGSGRWVRHAWTVSDAGLRSFMQNTSDFRFDTGPARVCLDRVEVAATAGLGPPAEYLVAAHYYPWYYRRRWDYAECNSGALRLELSPAQRPLLGRYDSSDPAVVGRHLRWCAEYGINVLILEFISPGSREDRICRDVILRHPRSEDVRFTVLYDWAIRFGALEVTPSRIATARSDFSHLAREYFPHPSYLRFGGERPVAMLYVTRALSGDVGALIGAIRQAGAERGFDIFLVGDEFFFPASPRAEKIARWDGIFGYDVYAGRGGYWADNGTLDLFRSRTDDYRRVAEAAGVKFFPSCAPGFNDRAVRRTCADNPAFSRRASAGAGPTSLFEETFGKIALERVDAEFPLVSITSFNEWHEDTEIEPTAGGGGSTSRDASPGGSDYTQGMPYDDFGFAYLELIRDATLAVTGTIRGPGGPVAGAAIDVLDGTDVVLSRRGFSTGAYTVPRPRLVVGKTYRLRVSSEGLGPAMSPPFTVLATGALIGLDVELAGAPAVSRGDCNADRAQDLSDAVYLLDYLFAGAARPRCIEACDHNGDGAADLSDAVYLLGHLFLGGAPPPAPAFPACEPLAGARGCPEGNCRP